jgi:hypothetical protein
MCASFEVYTPLWFSSPFFWDMTPRDCLVGCRILEVPYSLHLQVCRCRTLLGLLDEGTVFLRNAGNQLPSDAASYPRRTEFYDAM